MFEEKILIVDFADQDVQGVGRLLRDLGFYSVLEPYKNIQEKIDPSIKALVLVGNKRDNKEKELNFLKDSDIPYVDLIDVEFERWKEHLEDFTSRLGLSPSWSIEKYKDYAIRQIKDQVQDGRVLLGLSGGVDSSVCAKLISEAIGSKLTCILVDHGLMRKNEVKEIEDAFSDSDLNLVVVDAQDRFLGKLSGVTDPETKRKIIGEEFIRVFEEEAKKIGQVDYLAQGTIYSDIIESGDDDQVAIKSHHNVGGLPDYIDFKGLVEPLKFLFKDEVRKLGLVLNLDEKLVWRQPFPGPGLGIRVIGEITKEKLDMLRQADYIFRQEIQKAGLDKDYSQYFAVLTSNRSVGSKDGKRTYDYTLALRAIKTVDFMTGEFAKIPYKVLDKVSQEITQTIDGINRVVYDISNKPPATIEWE